MSGLIAWPTTTTITHCSARLAATVLLLVLFVGMAVMTFTHEWIGALPNHDHLDFTEETGHHHDHTHHAHPGDDLERALKELVNVTTPRGVLPTTTIAAQGGRAVIAFNAPSGQTDLSTFTASGALALLVIAGRLRQRERLWSPTCRALAGCTIAPLAPPPRPAR